MKRTSKALARIGIGAVTTAAILATPLAIGTASAAVGAINVTTTPGTVGSTPSGYAGEGSASATYTAGSTSTFGPQVLTLTLTSGSGNAYYPTSQPAGATRVDATHVTCTGTTTASGDTVPCSVNVGDPTAEAATVTAAVTTGDNTTPSGSGTVVFTSSSTAGTLAATPRPGTVTATSTPPAGYTGEGAVTATYTSNGTTSGVQTIEFQLAGNTGAYFVRTADQPAAENANTISSTEARCDTGNVPAGGTGSCTINVGDTTSESAHLQVSVHTGDTATTGITPSVPFNALYIGGCATTGVNTGGSTGNCVTQATVNSATPQTVTYEESGTGVSGKNLTATLNIGTAPHAQFATTGDSQIVSGTGNTQATCTTGSGGVCTFSVVDPIAGENATLDVRDTGAPAYPTTVPNSNAPGAGSFAPFPDAQAEEYVQFVAAAVAPAELDLISTRVIGPSTQQTGTTAGQTLAEPGDVIQNVYTLLGSQQPKGTGTCTTPGAPNTTTCPGVPLSNTSVTLKVSNGFFTPNCVFPQSSTSSTSVGAFATPTANNYGSCSFTPAPTTGGVTGNLTNSGQTATFKTDANGQFVASLGIAKDAGFDDDGTVVAAVSDGSIVPQVPGNNNVPTSSQCSSQAGAGALTVFPNTTAPTTESANTANGGCDVNVAWTTDEAPLNGGTAKYVVVPSIKNPNNTFIGSENNYGATDTGTVNVPDVDRVVFVTHLTDQFGNLTSNRGAAPATEASIVKTGPGNLIECTAFTQVDACSAGSHANTTGATQPDGTTTQRVIPVLGSYTNVVAGSHGQYRYEADASDPSGALPVNNSAGSGTPGVNDGTQTDVLSWNPETSTFTAYTAAGTSAAFATFASGTATTASTDTLTFNFYNQLAQPVITFSVKPGHKVPTSTAVTAAAKVLDQFNNPITDQLVQFVRSGPNEASCTPVQDEDNSSITTNAAGVAGFTFSCNMPGTSTVSIVVTGPGGTQLAQGKEAIKFTGSGTHVAKEKPTLKVHAKGHHVTLKIATHPKVHGKTVMFYRLKHGLPHLVGAAKTSKSGHAKLHLKLKSGKYHFEVKVAGLKATKYNSKYSKTKTIKV
jgi:hypothetical protein